MQLESKKAVIAAMLANFVIAVFKIAAALFSKSSSMMAEGYHSLSDTFNQILLLYGLKASQKKPDAKHPFGYGKEQFFWSFMVAIILFGIAGSLSIREGLHKLKHPEPISHLGLIYLAILIGIIFDSYALRIAFRKIKQEKKAENHPNFMEALKRSKDPTILTVFIEDLLAMIGLFIAAAAITIVHFTGVLVIDGIASILIGVLLMIFALFLAYETKGLLLGESITRNKKEKIMKSVNSFSEVKKIISLKTMHLSSEEVLVTLELNYQDNLIVDELERINDRIEACIKEIIPQAKVYLECENEADEYHS